MVAALPEAEYTCSSAALAKRWTPRLRKPFNVSPFSNGYTYEDALRIGRFKPSEIKRLVLSILRERGVSYEVR